MTLKSFEQTNFGDWQSEKMQTNVGDFLRQLEKFPFFKGNLLKEVKLLGTSEDPLTKDIQHKLNRVPNGYIIVKRNSSAVIYSYDDLKLTNKTTIRLTATAAVTVDIWIY